MDYQAPDNSNRVQAGRRVQASLNKLSEWEAVQSDMTNFTVVLVFALLVPSAPSSKASVQ